MITMKVKVVNNLFPELQKQAKTNSAKAVENACRNIQKASQEMMKEPKTGRVYPKLDGGLHQASAAGEAPAVDTGKLVGSLSTELKQLTGYVYTETDYSAYLEFGTSQMMKRPYFTPASQLVWPDFVAEMIRIYGTD